MAKLIQERYKIEYQIAESQDYVAYRVVDIEDREKKTYLLNVYSAANVKKFVKTFHDLKNCHEYKGEFVDGGKLVAVFDYKDGDEIKNVFRKKAHITQEYRFKSAEQLMNIALMAESFPDDIKKRMIDFGNFCVKQASERIDVNFRLDPSVCNENYIGVLTGALRWILPKTFSEPEKEREFFLSLKKNSVKDGIELYARWKKAFPGIKEEYKIQVSMPMIERFFVLLGKNVKWFFKSHFM